MKFPHILFLTLVLILPSCQSVQQEIITLEPVESTARQVGSTSTPAIETTPQPDATVTATVGLEPDQFSSQPTDLASDLPVYWRVGGKTGLAENPFAIPSQIEVNSDGMVYVADAVLGLVILDWEGNYIQTILPQGAQQITDIERTYTGSLVLADRGGQQILILDSNGTELSRFGKPGFENGSFGDNSPLLIALYPQDEWLYVLDTSIDETGSSFARIQLFDLLTGDWMDTITLPEDMKYRAYSALEADANGYLYLIDPHEDCILRFDPGSKEVVRWGEDSLKGTSPAALAISPEGEIYVALSSAESGQAIRVLDALGHEYRQFGNFTLPGQETSDWPEGSFSQPNAIGADPFGMFIFVSEYTEGFAYLTAYQLFE